MEPAAEPSGIRRHLAELVPAEAGVVTATLAGMMVAGPPGALVGGSAAAVVQHVTKEAMGRRFQRASEAVETAAEGVGLTPEELLERIRADDRLLELAAAVIAAAAETDLQAKVKALGQALARGTLTTDDAEIDQERFIVGTLAALEAPHIRVLQEIKGTDLSLHALYERLPQSASVLRPVIGALRANGLIYDMTDGSFMFGGEESERWALTDYGSNVLELLESQRSEGPGEQPV